MRYFSGIVLVCGVLLVSSCMKKDDFPDTPEIDLEGWVSIFDTTQFAVQGILTIGFRDGNGDIGLNGYDTLPPYNKNGPYYYNYVITYFEKQYGTFVRIDLDPPYSARIPYLTPDDPNKAIKGIIVDTLDLNPVPVFDTIRFELFIYDRALNKSNVLTTPEIILRKH